MKSQNAKALDHLRTALEPITPTIDGGADMDSLTTLLDRAAGPVAALGRLGDLARGRRALARTRRRRGAAGLLGVAAASVVGVAVGQVRRPSGARATRRGGA